MQQKTVSERLYAVRHQQQGHIQQGHIGDHPEGLHVSIETPPGLIDITRCRCTRKIYHVVKRQEP
jgi:GTP cyclohydrolase FolE2